MINNIILMKLLFLISARRNKIYSWHVLWDFSER